MIYPPVSGFRPPFAMDALTACCITRFVVPSGMNYKNRVLSRRSGFRVCAASGDDPAKLDHWDQMELKFGRLLGEDPNLTLAKVVGRKSNPDVSYLDIEKSFQKNKGKSDDISTIPLEGSKEMESSNSPDNLRRPAKSTPVGRSKEMGSSYSPDDLRRPTKSTQMERKMNLLRPVMKKGVKPEIAGAGAVLTGSASSQFLQDNGTKNDISNVILRKPSTVQADNIETEKSSQFKIKPNLYLKMRNENKEPIENFSDVALLKKPVLMKLSLNPNVDDSPSNDISLSRLPEPANEQKKGLQPTEQNQVEPHEMKVALTIETSLQGKPHRSNEPRTEGSLHEEEGKTNLSDESDTNASEIKAFQSPPLEEHEISYWKKAEALFQTGERVEVELVSCSNRGFVVSFGSLLGFLPYRNLGAKWKFLAFESWLRKKGLDPSLYKQNSSIIGSSDVQTKNLPPDSSLSSEAEREIEEKQKSDMKLEDLLEAYDQEKTQFLSSFIGQRIKVGVVVADRNLRKVMFSGRPREKQELVERKRNLMAKLSIGDVVKCYIKKITYFGIFVEVEGVPALIHQSEVSWDATLDPSSYYRNGQIVEAKVHQLDFGLERITLSLKQILPDPLTAALEFVVGDHSSLDGPLETAQPDTEWADVESLIKELQQMKGVNDVSKGRFFLSPGLAPTFQVYMTSMFKNQYKLLARSGNKVQEVIVEASMDNEQMKTAILSCTNRVE